MPIHGDIAWLYVSADTHRRRAESPADPEANSVITTTTTRFEIENCPKRSLLAAHYGPSGHCRCGEHTEAVAELTRARSAAQRAQAAVARAQRWVEET